MDARAARTSDREAIYVYGASGHGRVVAEGSMAMGFRVVGFVDDALEKRGTIVNGVPVIGGVEALKDLPRDAAFAIGIGSNRAREKVAALLTQQGRRVVAIVHPSAVIAARTRIGDGSYVGPLAIVHVNAEISSHCIVNTGAIVDHDCRLADFCHVSVNAALGGGSTVGEGTLIGIGASVLPQVKVGAWTEVGAGAVVTRDLGDGVIAFGVPARVVRPGRA